MVMWVYVALIAVAFLTFVIGISTDDGAFGVMTFLLAVAAFVWLFIGGHHFDTIEHNKAVNQLRQQGFNVTTHHVHIGDEKVDFGCVTLGLHKIEGVYRVTVNRDKLLGGGYNVVKPAQVAKIRKDCPND